MAPQSPTHAFDPTPALEENKENYSPLNDRAGIKSFQSYSLGQRGGRDVHFADPPTSTSAVPRAHSIATSTVPLLPPVSSASQLPSQSSKRNNSVPGIDINAYVEHSRSLLESQRLNHERDKKAWDDERMLWNQERNMLKAQIADLEFRLNRSTDGKRRHSNDDNSVVVEPSRAEYNNFRAASIRHFSESRSGPPPVWEGPQNTAPVTRVFSNENGSITSPHTNHLSSISEDEAMAFPSLSQQVSPTSKISRVRSESAVPVPIERIDDRLDGITLRSTALAPSFTATIRTPSENGTPVRISSPLHDRPMNGGLNVITNGLISPFDEKLKRHAGNTPMNFEGAGSALDGSSAVSTEVTTPTKENPNPGHEQPLEPAPTKRPPLRPSENSDSYFSFSNETKSQLDASKGEYRTEEVLVEKDDLAMDHDPELQEPLMLDSKNHTHSAHDFLSKVDQKLAEAAAATRKDGMSNDLSSLEEVKNNAQVKNKDSDKVEKDLDMPRLRMKKSTNFGSAYGWGKPGNI